MRWSIEETEDQKLARRAKGFGKPLLLFQRDAPRPMPIGALLLNDDYFLLRYLSGGCASRSAYRRFDERMRDVGRAAVTNSLSQRIDRLSDGESLRTISISAANGKPKAVILPWIEYSLTSRAVKLRSRSTFLKGIRRDAKNASFDSDERVKRFEEGLLEKGFI
jgi:hypothetical protein